MALRDEIAEDLIHILQAVKEYCEELIGEDISYKDLGDGDYIEEKIKNQFRQELRERLKKDLGN